MPPFTGNAVNFTVVPEQTGLASAVIVTLAGSAGLTFMMTAFEVTGLPVAQVALEVITTVIESPLSGTNEYVGELFPTGIFLLYH